MTPKTPSHFVSRFESADGGNSNVLRFLSDPEFLQQIDTNPTVATEAAAEIAMVAACEDAGPERCVDANAIEVLVKMIAKYPTIERVNRHAVKALNELLGSDPNADQVEENRRIEQFCDLMVAKNLPAMLVSMINSMKFEFGVSGANCDAIVLLHAIFKSNARNAQHCVLAKAGPAVKAAQSCQRTLYEMSAKMLLDKCDAHPDAVEEESDVSESPILD